jgi:hypothetical protein
MVALVEVIRVGAYLLLLGFILFAAFDLGRAHQLACDKREGFDPHDEQGDE